MAVFLISPLHFAIELNYNNFSKVQTRFEL